jgi:hypothetical protein
LLNSAFAQPAAPATAPATRPAAAASQPFVLRINCAGGEYKDPRGNVWMADHEYIRGGWGFVEGGAVDRGNIAIANTDMARIFLTERYSVGGYRLLVPADGKYTLALLFAETFDDTNHVGARQFDVSVQGKSFLSKFDIVKEAGGHRAAVAVVTELDVTDGKVTIYFDGVVRDPIINGLVLMQGSGDEVRKAATAGVTKIVERKLPASNPAGGK